LSKKVASDRNHFSAIVVKHTPDSAVELSFRPYTRAAAGRFARSPRVISAFDRATREPREEIEP